MENTSERKEKIKLYGSRDEKIIWTGTFIDLCTYDKQTQVERCACQSHG